jgi:beta-galactosidase
LAIGVRDSEQMREWRSWAGPGVAFGGDYNPEQWPREVWHEDVALMREAGVTFVSLGIFSWSHLQPTPDTWEFGWLDDAMDLLHANGIAVDLATATASPPPWFSRRFPETLPQRQDGTRLWQGSRQAWCPSSTVFTEHATALAERVAARYADHPALSMWHVSNEYGCHNVPCYCDVCAAGFRTWLLERYGDLDALNEAWGTAFWSQRYSDVEEIVPPRPVPAFPNPGQELDHRRYMSDALLRQYRAELDVLRRVTPEVPVTTNFMTLDHFRHLDYPAWVPHVDVVSTDHYLTVREDPEAELSFGADLTRGLSGGEPWLLMEHSTSAVNWQHVNVAKGPGQMMRNSLAHVARGADALGFFQWRASRAGAEKFHSGLVPHAGTDTRLWREVVELGAVVGRLGEVRGSRVEADVALLWDFNAGWACDQQAHPSSEVAYGDVAHDLHAALRDQGFTVDVVPVDDRSGLDLTRYQVVLVPTLYLCSDATAAAVQAAADAGAHVLVTFFSGIVDEHDHVRLGGYPGAFRDLLGVRTEEFYPLLAEQTVTVDGLGDGSTGRQWTELLTCTDAEAVATYTDGPLPGVPAVTRREIEGPTSGSAAWYVATRLDPAATTALLRRVMDEAGVRPVADVPSGVEVVRRRSESGSWLFVLNHTAEDVTVDVAGHDLVGDAPVDPLRLASGRCAVVREG